MPPEEKRQNVVADLSADRGKIEEARRQKSDEAQLKEGEWVSLDALKENLPDEEENEQE